MACKQSALILILFTALLGLAACRNAPPATPSIAPSPHAAPFADWSPAVNGLQAHLVTASVGDGYLSSIFLELRNVGDKPMNFPSLRIFSKSNDLPWKLQIEQAGQWKAISWGDVQFFEHMPDSLVIGREVHEPSDPVTLQSRQTGLVQILGHFASEMHDAQRFRVIVAQSGQGPIAEWSGHIETPPARVRLPAKDLKALQGQLPAPTYFPQFARILGGFPNGSGLESQFLRLWASNQDLLFQLALYQPVPTARELERRLASEGDFHLKLLVATEAARCGSAPSRDFILAALQETDYQKCLSALDALRFLDDDQDTPDWVLDAMIATLADQRSITNIPSNWAAGTSFTVSRLADGDANLTFRLGNSKCRRAVPVLINLVKKDDYCRSAISALGQIGDPAAIPVLMDVVKNRSGNLEIWSGTLSPEEYDDALQALVALRADGIAEILLAQVVHHDIVTMLESLGDRRAVPILKQIVATGKPRQIKGSSLDSDRSCAEAARIALATLEPGDPIPRYCALVHDQSLDKFTRREAIWRLGDKEHIDPRAIPVLARAAREDPEGTVADNAIIILGEYQYASAVTALIDLFAADFAGKQNWKYAYEPSMFRDHVARSLKKSPASPSDLTPSRGRDGG